MFALLCGCAKASRSEVGIGLLDLVDRIHHERPAGDNRLIYGIGVTQNEESETVCSNLQAISLSQLDEIDLGHDDPVHAGLATDDVEEHVPVPQPIEGDRPASFDHQGAHEHAGH